MHHFKAKNGTHFNFNSDMSGDVHIHRDRMIAAVVSGFDLLEFAQWYAGEYASVSAPTSELEALRGLAHELRVAETGVGWTLRGPLEGAEAILRDLFARLPEHTGALPAPDTRPARDVAHDILDKSGWRPNPAVSLTEAADAIVAIIRADRKGGE